MLFDSTLLFWHTGNVYNFTAGEFVSLAGQTTSASTAINLGNARDLGIGPGEELPMVEVLFGTAITVGGTAGQQVNIQFQGSTNSTLWTTYIETGYQNTASFAAGSGWRFDVPRRPPGAALPLYYQLNVVTQGLGTASVTPISTGTILAGIVIGSAESAGTLDQYAAGYSVA